MDCTKALELDPDYAKAVARRATARTKLKKYEGAKEDQERLLELQPNNKQAKLEITKLEKVSFASLSISFIYLFLIKSLKISNIKKKKYLIETVFQLSTFSRSGRYFEFFD